MQSNYNLNVTLNAVKKGAIIGPSESAEYYNKLADKRIFKPSRKLFAPIYVTYYFRKYSNLVGIFDKAMQSLVEAGLIDFWQKPIRSIHLEDEFDEGSRLKALAFAHVEGIFIVATVLYFIAILMFLLEMLSMRVRFLRLIFK